MSLIAFIGFLSIAILGPLWPWMMKWKVRTFPRQHLRDPDMGHAISPYFQKKLFLPSSGEYMFKTDEIEQQKCETIILYLSGFTAGTEEIFPVVEQVSKHFGWPAFFHRHPGHGGLPQTMGLVRVEDYILSVEQSYEMARRIAKEVLVIGTSTGAALGLDLALKHEVKALVMISPNFKLRDWRSQFCRGPLGARILRMMIGPWIHVPSDSQQVSQRWVRKYPMRALATLIDLTAIMSSNRPRDLQCPGLAFLADSDPTIHSQYARAFLEGAPNIQTIVYHSAAHVLAGQWTAPENTQAVVAEIKNFLEIKFKRTKLDSN
jgi:esterase/lipase